MNWYINLLGIVSFWTIIDETGVKTLSCSKWIFKCQLMVTNSRGPILIPAISFFIWYRVHHANYCLLYWLPWCTTDQILYIDCSHVGDTRYAMPHYIFRTSNRHTTCLFIKRTMEADNYSTNEKCLEIDTKVSIGWNYSYWSVLCFVMWCFGRLWLRVAPEISMMPQSHICAMMP